MKDLVQYSYLLIALYFLVIWLGLFLRAEKNREEMIKGSLIGIVLGPAVQWMHLVDWWQPKFIYPAAINIEDMLFGFSVAGIACVLYEVILNKKERRYKRLQPTKLYDAITVGAGLVMLFGLFIIFRVHSFTTSVIGAAVVVVLILLKRKDLLIPMFITGVLIMLIAVPVYLFILSHYPTVFKEQWLLDNLSGIEIGNIPIEELVWYMIAGASFSCGYEFIFGVRFSVVKPTLKKSRRKLH